MKNLLLCIGLFAMGVCSLLLVACNENPPTVIVPPEDTVSVSPTGALLFGGLAGTDTLIVHSNGTWEIYGYAYWASVSPQSGKDGDTLIVSVDTNTTPDERQVNYLLYSGDAKCTLLVTQQGGPVPTAPIIEQVKYTYKSFDYEKIVFVEPKLECTVKAKGLGALQVWSSRLDNMVIWDSDNYKSPERIGEDTYRIVIAHLQWSDALMIRAYNNYGESDFCEVIYVKDYIEDPDIKALIDKELERWLGN